MQSMLFIARKLHKKPNKNWKILKNYAKKKKFEFNGKKLLMKQMIFCLCSKNMYLIWHVVFTLNWDELKFQLSFITLTETNLLRLLNEFIVAYLSLFVRIQTASHWMKWPHHQQWNRFVKEKIVCIFLRIIKRSNCDLDTGGGADRGNKRNQKRKTQCK